MMRILAIRIDGIGDLLCITPMLHDLRGLFPQATIDVLANAEPHIVLKENPDIDRLLIDYRTKMEGSRWKGLYYIPARLVRWLNWKVFGYDLVIVAHYGIHERAIRLARSIRTKQIIACVEPNEEQRFADSRIHFAPYKHMRHEASGVYAVLSPWTTNHDAGRMWLFTSKTKSNKTLNPTKPPLICINLTASCSKRTWHQDYFKELLVSLAQEFPNLKFNITGTLGDISQFEQIFLGLPSTISARTKVLKTPTLTDFIKAVASCDIFIGSEGGGMHIASALGIPQVALFENVPRKLLRWRPWKVPHAVVYSAHPGSPVSDIKPAQVLEAIRPLIHDVLSKQATAAS